MIGIIDYGVGNVFSVMNALQKLNLESRLVSRESDFEQVNKLILPGVGAFDNAMQSLLDSGLKAPLEKSIAAGVPTMGVCLGMQLLCTGSDEGKLTGLGIFDHRVAKFQSSTLIIPHMGWNRVEITGSTLFSKENSGYFYFVHSYYVPMLAETTGIVTYGDSFSAIIEKENVIGVQFHPEKSGACGLALLKKFGGQS